jgi:hypothetical protein
MEIYNIRLMSKNNKKTGYYIYSVVVRDLDRYYYCRSINSNKVITKGDLSIGDIEIIREISKEYYIANGIK